MKIKKHLVALLTVIAIIASVLCLNACGDPNDIINGMTKTEYTVTVDTEKSVALEIGDTVDYRQYFTVTDQNGNQIVVTEEMLDLSKVDTTKEGQFTVTLAIGNASKSITFTVGNNGNGGDGGDDDLATVLAKYADSTNWNFATALACTYNGGYEEYYEYKGNDIKYEYEDDGEHTDYIEYVSSTDKYYYYSEQTDGSYEKYEEGTEDFDNWFWYAAYVDLTEIKDFEFTENSGVYSAKQPNEVGNSVIGEFTNITWTSFTLTIKNGNLATISAVMSDGDAYTYTFSKFGTVNFTLPDVGSQGDNGDDENGGNDSNLATILAKYADSSKWNFATALKITDSDGDYNEYYEYNGNNVKYVWEEDGDEYTDYIEYVSSTDKYYYYAEQGNGSYEKYAEGTDDFDDWFWYAAPVNLSEIKDFEFTESNGVYSANKPNDVGNNVIGEFTNITWTSFTLTIKSGNLATITVVMSDNTTYTYTFSKFGTVNFTLPNVSGGTTTPVTPVTPVTPTETMDKQTYNEATFDNERLQDKITKTGDEPDSAIGLPSKGKYNALVIPVQFSNDAIKDGELEKLNIAFNGDSANTGWESVHSYYYKSSYEQLDISFDIAGYNFVQNVSTFTANYNYSYYASHTATDPETKQKYNDGDNLLLHEALKYYDAYIDFSNYDYNNDGTIDAVYLIYSAPIDYESNDSFYWAYVTWNYDDSQYDGKDVFYYLFAGLDFMLESVNGGYTNEYYPEIDGLKVNASTYIHETGHLLGLDDYYDYDEDSGCNEGLGGADMMDATVGDQNVYSKIMLGWLTPQIVVSTQTVTIKSSQERGDAILIPLNFDNSYFCEYLLIDLYSSAGLNALHASADNSYLYDGADYGVRIYHVSSSINDVYSSDYGSFTDYNNTDTNIALIKLIEADGTTKYSNSSGYAADSDLWQAGKTLGSVFPNYATNAGKKLNFDISIDSVSATQATITITYAA